MFGATDPCDYVRKILPLVKDECLNKGIKFLKLLFRSKSFNPNICSKVIGASDPNFGAKSLVSKGLAEQSFKPMLTEIKNEYKNKDLPEWIEIIENDYIRVS